MTTVAEDMKTLFGPVRRWKEDGVLFAENDWLKMAYFVTDDPEKLGQLGFEGPREICVEYIDQEKGRLWDDARATISNGAKRDD